MKNKLFSILALISLLLYFAASDIFTNAILKFFVGLFCFFLVASDLILIQTRLKEIHPEEKKLRILTSLLGIFSFILNLIRNYLEFNSLAGVNEEATIIPKLRDLLLLFITLSTLSFILLSIINLINKDANEIQSSLKNKKMGLLKNTLFGFFTISPIIIAVNYLAVMKNYNFDLSSIGKFSFSTTSRQILKEVKNEITVTAFFPRPLEGDGRDDGLALSYIRPEVEIYLDQLKNSNPNFKTSFVNAEVEKELMGDFSNVSNGMILLRSLKKSSDSSGNPYNEERVIVQSKKDLEDLEKKLVQSVLNLSTSRKKVYFTVSNGEHYGANFTSIHDELITKFTSILSFYNYSINELGFKEGWPEKVPDDADAVFIIGPNIKFNESATNSILSYIEKKGKLFITIDPKSEENFDWLVNKAGINLKKESIRQVEGRQEIIANKFQSHPIEELIFQKEKGVYFLANAYFETKPTENQTLISANLLESGFDSYLDLNKNSKLDKEEKQNSYPLVIVLSSKISEENKNSLTPESPSRIIISSGTSWVTNRYIAYNLNSILAMNSINWLNQSVLTERILVKKEDSTVTTISDKQKLVVWLFGLFIFPISISLGFGFYSYRKRNIS